ncbi:nickel/cobalt transporter [Rhizobium sp. SL42]|uniref:nickel/cobalt transporter n=1 Tax=Rhizobium sp. SL42 TaxID=2806346 RepID=UPI001F3A1C31|nr:nickel/cobalt transporter [Rhizobium sp. SL42]UJW74696.1 nickel/cobalt transporter [Rhizobium sp. SL42]
MLSRLEPKRLPAIALLAAGLVLAAGFAHAASPLGVGTAEPSFQPSGPFAGWLVWINTHQQAFYRALTGSLKAMRDDPWQLTGLIGLSFAYGIFHAAGPGHGKAVISSYLLANEVELRRGIVISFASAFLQAAVAIGVVALAYLALRGTTISMTDATQALEIGSYAMIILFGTWLLVRKVRTMLRQTSPLPASVSASLFDSPVPATGIENSALPSLFAPAPNSAPRAKAAPSRFVAQAIAHDHDALAPGSVCTECGIAHVPDPKMLSGQRFDLRAAWAAIIAVGLRPCSGALLVMTFALLNGLYLGGVLSVLAMALGTAITVSVLASLAVGAKAMAIRLSGPQSAKAHHVSAAIEIGGALVVILLGAVLLAAALQP